MYSKERERELPSPGSPPKCPARTQVLDTPTWGAGGRDTGTGASQGVLVGSWNLGAEPGPKPRLS